MRISDWSSDVCSSDLGEVGAIRFIESDTGRETFDRLEPVWGEFTVQWLTDKTVTFTRIQAKAGGDDPMTNMMAVVGTRSEEHTSELQSLMRMSYAVFCLKKKTYINIE